MRARSLFIGAIAATALAAPAARAQRDSERWNWNGTITEGRWLYVRNLNGAIRVEPATGNQVEVEAVKEVGRRGNLDDVKITVEQRSNHGDVVICAVWEGRNTRCDEDGYSSNSSRSWWDRDRNNSGDVSVDFVVRLPKGIRVTTTTVNGQLEIDGVDSEIQAHTVNGSIIARSNGGPVSAGTTNGSLTIRTGALGREPLEYSTVNGQITLEIPDSSNADVELRTVNGSINTDFPLTIEGRSNPRRVRGSIGKGGPLIRLSTTNGSIRLRRG